MEKQPKDRSPELTQSCLGLLRNLQQRPPLTPEKIKPQTHVEMQKLGNVEQHGSQFLLLLSASQSILIPGKVSLSKGEDVAISHHREFHLGTHFSDTQSGNCVYLGR